jgi:dCMP deaminase
MNDRSLKSCGCETGSSCIHDPYSEYQGGPPTATRSRGKTLIQVFGLESEGERARAKHCLWMGVAQALSRLTKCRRAPYGTVILDYRGRVVATGYNGKPMGSDCDDACFREGLPPDCKSKPKCCLHSEQNALVFGNYSEYQGGTFYVTGLPCEDCALLICQSGVKTLVCLEDTRGYPGLETIANYGFFNKVEVVILDPEEVKAATGAADSRWETSGR